MQSPRVLLPLVLLVFTLVAFCIGCSTAPKGEGAKADLRQDAEQTIADYKATDPSTAELFSTAYGYAVFPKVTKGGAGIGGAHGRGVLYQGGQAVGYCDLSQATIGLQLGGQQYSEVIFFENAHTFDAFKSEQYAFAAQASAVALASGSAADAEYRNGVIVMTDPISGLMAEASIGGQKFRFEPMPEVQPPPAAPEPPIAPGQPI